MINKTEYEFWALLENLEGNWVKLKQLFSHRHIKSARTVFIEYIQFIIYGVLFLGILLTGAILPLTLGYTLLFGVAAIIMFFVSMIHAILALHLEHTIHIDMLRYEQLNGGP